jgi:predicted nuclease of predicted toxin-antitoxin system
MKLLFDENLPPRLTQVLADLYPGSQHVREVGLQRAEDERIWEWAARHSVALVSKDSAFVERALVRGCPPKVVRWRVGNCPTEAIVALLRTHSVTLHAFYADPVERVLFLP